MFHFTLALQKGFMSSLLLFGRILPSKPCIKQQRCNLGNVVALAGQTRGAVRVVLELFGYFFGEKK